MMFKTTANSFYKSSTRKGTSMSLTKSSSRNTEETNENDGSVANKSGEKSDNTV